MFKALKDTLLAGFQTSLEAFGPYLMGIDREQLAQKILDEVCAKYEGRGFYLVSLVHTHGGAEIGCIVFSSLGHVSPTFADPEAVPGKKNEPKREEAAMWRENCRQSIVKDDSNSKFPKDGTWHIRKIEI